MACKILIVDSDEMMRIFLRDVFWMHGGSTSNYIIDTAKSISEAEAYLANNPKPCPDIIFLDLSAARTGTRGRAAETESTLNFIREVKKDKDCGAKTSFIIFSSYDDPSIREKAKEVGADHFLVKGEYMPKELIDFVNEHYAIENLT